MEFEFNEWNVPLIQEPNILMNKLKNLDVRGRKIVNIKCVGICYNLDEDDIEDYVYNYYNKQGAKNLHELSEYENIDGKVPFSRFVEIDEPIIFYLDDGNRLEIEFSEASSIKLGKNSLPEDITFGINKPNANVNVVFSNCLNSEIIGFKVIMEDELSADYTGSFGIPEPINQNSYISSFKICLNDGKSIEFNSFYDYGHVYVCDEKENISTICWKELQNGIAN